MANDLPDLDFDSILADAVARAGLDDFGRASFREPLSQLLKGLREEANLSATGRAIQRERIVSILVTNLQFESFWQRFPEIADETIKEPLVIIGFGRTGTTMLQRLLAADPRFYSTLWWEARFPVPFPGESVEKPDQRIQAALDEVAMMYETVPNLEAIHPMDAMQADEEILLLEQSFYSTTPESFAKITAFSAWLDAQDQTPGYEMLKRLLQFLQWQKRRRGVTGDRWVLKSPHHIHYSNVLIDVFPDARFVQTHRDPVEVMPSWASLNFSLWQQNSDVADPLACGMHWNAKMSEGMLRCMRTRDAGHDDRFLDVDFRNTARDPMVVLTLIYEFIDWEHTEKARAAQQSWLADNRRDLRPPHDYTLEMFGYTEEGLKETYRQYRERFIL
ncbi:MAG: sulfotransferase [bacterium]|nr:sulfotransferase [Deltaproteobacteria bacterium]MCP4908399.1 sulfotransferase [bacterium]